MDGDAVRVSARGTASTKRNHLVRKEKKMILKWLALENNAVESCRRQKRRKSIRAEEEGEKK